MADIQRQIRQYRATHGVDMPQSMIDALIQGAAKTNADQATRRAALAQDASQFDRSLALKSEMFDTQEKRLKQAQESQQLMGGLGLAYKVGGDIWKNPTAKEKIKDLFGFGGTKVASADAPSPAGELASATFEGPITDYQGEGVADAGTAGGMTGDVAQIETPGYGETVTQFAGSTSADPYGETQGMFSASDAPVPGGAIDAGQDAVWDAAAGEWTGSATGTDGGIGGEIGGGLGGVAGAGGVSAGLTAGVGLLTGNFDLAKTADSGIAGAGGYLAAVGAGGGPVGIIAGAVAGTVISQVLGGGRVICTELNRQGLIDPKVYALDQEYTRSYLDADVIRGYLFWAQPIANGMRRSKLLTRIVRPIAHSWSYTMAATMRPGEYQPRRAGKLMLKYGVPLCRALGRYLRKREEEATAWTC
jgi:hypothetical protein